MLEVGDEVWIKDLRIWGIVKELCKEPRSFIVNCARGNFRRTRSHLIKLLPSESTERDDEDDSKVTSEKKIEENVEESTEANTESTEPTQVAGRDVPRCGTRIRKPPDFFHLDLRFNSSQRSHKK